MSYEKGFIDKCAEYGVNPQELIKQAQMFSNMWDKAKTGWNNASTAMENATGVGLNPVKNVSRLWSAANENAAENRAAIGNAVGGATRRVFGGGAAVGGNRGYGGVMNQAQNGQIPYEQAATLLRQQKMDNITSQAQNGQIPYEQATAALRPFKNAPSKQTTYPSWFSGE